MLFPCGGAPSCSLHHTEGQKTMISDFDIMPLYSLGIDVAAGEKSENVRRPCQQRKCVFALLETFRNLFFIFF